MELLESINSILDNLKPNAQNSNEWIGVIGTLLGTILGWVLNSISRRGKLKIYIYNWKDSFWSTEAEKMSDYCFGHGIDNISDDYFLKRIPSNSKEEAKYYEYMCSMDIYNSSENSKIMRNIKIVFYEKKHWIKKKIKEDIPRDYSTKNGKNEPYYYSEIEPVNIKPKTVKKIDLIHQLRQFDFIWDAKQVFLEYTDEKSRQKRIRIKKEDYQRYFQNCAVEVNNGQAENAHAE